MLFDRSEGAQGRSVRGISSSLSIELLPHPAEVLRFVVHNREHPAQEEQVARLDCFDVSAERSRSGRELNAKILQPAICPGRLRTRTAYHRPTCAPPSTCSTSPVTLGASVTNTTASAISFASTIEPIGERVFMKSLGSSL